MGEGEGDPLGQSSAPDTRAALPGVTVQLGDDDDDDVAVAVAVVAVAVVVVVDFPLFQCTFFPVFSVCLRSRSALPQAKREEEENRKRLETLASSAPKVSA